MHFWACSLMHISGNPLPKKIYARKKDISNNEKRKLSDDFLKLNLSAFNCSQNGKTMAKWLPIHWNRLEMESRLHKGVTSWLNSKTLLAVTVVAVFLSLFKWNQNLVGTMAKRSNWVRIWIDLDFNGELSTQVTFKPIRFGECNTKRNMNSVNVLRKSICFPKIEFVFFPKFNRNSIFVQQLAIAYHTFFFFPPFFLVKLFCFTNELFCCAHHEHLPPMMRIVVIFIYIYTLFFCVVTHVPFGTSKSIKMMLETYTKLSMGHFCIVLAVCVCVEFTNWNSEKTRGEKNSAQFKMRVYKHFKQLSENSRTLLMAGV